MEGAKEVPTPIASAHSLLKSQCIKEAFEPTSYRYLVGSLQYLNLMRPDIAFTINKLSQFMHCPNRHHWLALKRLLQYLKSTIAFGLRITPLTPSKFHAFSDVDWTGDP